jgi:hypothetical protein
MAKKTDKESKKISEKSETSKTETIANLRAARVEKVKKPKIKLPAIKPLYTDPDAEITAAQREAMVNLNADIRAAGAELGKEGARMLVDMYYQQQGIRLVCEGQYRAAIISGEPTALFAHTYGNQTAIERQLKAGLDSFAQAYRVGNWIKSLFGLGEVAAAGMLSYIDVRRAPTVGHVWRFAGIAGDGQIWYSRDAAEKFVAEICGKRGAITDEQIQQIADRVMRKVDNYRQTALRIGKGKLTRATLAKAACMRPYCKDFKVFAIGRIGSSLISHDKPGNLYRPIYDQHKADIERRNAEGEYHDYAIARAKTVKASSDARKWYEKGLLPVNHIHRRAARIMVKILLSHVHAAIYEDYYGVPAPRPYILEKDPRHTHLIPIPNWPGNFPGKSIRELYGESSDPPLVGRRTK